MYARKFYFAIVSLLVTAISGSVAMASTWYVDDSHTSGTRDGTSWATAFQFLQEALDASASLDTIKVAQGTYYPDEGSGHTNNSRSESFGLITDVTVLGGYIGYNDAAPDTRDTALYETLLSGDIGTTSVSTDNSFHVITASGVSNTAILDGCTITAGYASGSTTAERTGAGIFVTGTNSSPTFDNCIVTSNEAINPLGSGGTGGGIGSTSNGGSPIFTNCVISGNKAGSSGGGASLSSPLLARFIGCTFTTNNTTAASDIGGGALFTTVSGSALRTVRLVDCEFSGNSTTEAPGGTIYHQGTNNTLEVFGCRFESNTASGGSGGGIFVTSSGITTIKNSVFTSNQCKLPSIIGGGGGDDGRGRRIHDVRRRGRRPIGRVGSILRMVRRTMLGTGL
jgi:parallel beta-helix repeat protein